MQEKMKRGRSQVIWRYTPGALFRYNESGGWCSTTSVVLQDTGALDGALARTVGAALRRWNAIGPTGFPDPVFQSAKYVVGEPYGVYYSIWPLVFTCRTCGRVHFYREIERLRQVNDRLGCLSCRGREQLRQVPYAYVCECGRIESVYMPRHEGQHTIELFNKGSFQESYWYCKVCRKPLYRTPREGLGFRRCECLPKKGKRGILLEDSRIYYSQTVDLVDIEPRTLDLWRGNPRFSDLIIGAALSISAYQPSHVLDLARRKPLGNVLSPEMQAMKQVLMQTGKTEAEADAMVRSAANLAGADPWAAYDIELSKYRSSLPTFDWKESRQSVEYVFVRDEPSSVAISLEVLIAEATSAGDTQTADRYTSEVQLALDLGLVNLRILESLPIMLAGIGYTRYFSTPQEAAEADGPRGSSLALRPYGTQDGKIPIYVAKNTTEALLFELNPYRLAAFLSLNCGLIPPAEATVDEASIKAWLLGQVRRLVEASESHLVLNSYELDAGAIVDEPSALAFGVLHTLSHVLKATAHRFVGIDADSLAEYLFPAHGSGLLYASAHVEFTLGGIDSVFRSNLTQWLGSARDYADQCSFDPVCSSMGGACLACLYAKFGCAYFNRSLSRSYLRGGSVPGRTRRVMGYWSPEVISEEMRLRGQAPSASTEGTKEIT